MVVSVSSSKRTKVIIIGGGHNALIHSAYLARHRNNHPHLDITVLERRHVIGGAAVTEELYSGFKFSRASYLAGLLRPQIIQELHLQQYGFEYLTRNPSSFTPTLNSSDYHGKYLVFSNNSQETYQSIAQFSTQDADKFKQYEDMLSSIREFIQPFLDSAPIDFNIHSRHDLYRKIQTFFQLLQHVITYQHVVIPFFELLFSSTEHLLHRWFESDILKATLATDAVIGSLSSPKSIGSAYVLLHHVMGESNQKGVWSYMRGGMGTISNSIASTAQEYGVVIETNATVQRILTHNNQVTGVMLTNGTQLEADIIVSGCNPYHTFIHLLPDPTITWPKGFIHRIQHTDYTCGAMKINLAVDCLPNFTCLPNSVNGKSGLSHQGTIHFECTLKEIHQAYCQASQG
jgi:phytoene dehydrogenase-like protein